MSHPWYGCHPPMDGAALAQRLWQTERALRELSERVRQLETRLDEVRSRPPLHVEYHFDQLKVNELKGTLNVGLSPQGVEGMDSLEVPPSEWPAPAPAGEAITPEPIGALQQQMADYMDREAPLVLAELEKRQGKRLGDEHRLRVLGDVKNQLKTRVHYYAKTAPYPLYGTDEERKRWQETVIGKTIRDVESAFSAYLAGLPGTNGSGGGGTP